MIRGCIFDLDGTLIYTIDTIAHYVNKTFQKYGIGQLTAAEILPIIGKGARDLIEKCMRRVGGYTTAEFFETVFADYKAAYDSQTNYLSEPYDGIRELICELMARGIKLGILSNKQHSATVAIAKHFFGDDFDLVYGAVDGCPLKPDPAMLNMMMEAFGLEKGEVAYFGDMESDIVTGKNAGVGLVGAVAWGYQKKEELLTLGADRVFDCPADIAEVIS